jgi:hypothetical protein
MAQIQQELTAVDPTTQAFIADRLLFWKRFTHFTVGAVIVIILLVVGMWLFLT